MTEERDPTTPLSPEDEREVSRLLAEAGGEVTMPPEVAARLSGVLADLAEERAGDATVVPLRSRRRWPAALLAAAAVAVGGLAVGNLVGDGSMTAGEGGDAARPEAAADAGGSDGGTTADREDEEAQPPPRRQPVRLRSDQLEADVLRVLTAPVQELRRHALSGYGQRGDDALKLGCRPADLDRRDSWFRATYDGRRAVLVLAPERAGAVDASVFSCGGGLLDSTTVPAP